LSPSPADSLRIATVERAVAMPDVRPLAVDSRVPALLRATIVALSILHLVPPLLRPAQFLQDDSYFYLQIASNIVAGRGETFHEITPTNGYHPLWMAAAVAAFVLAEGEKVAALQVAVALQVLLTLGTLLLFYRLARLMELESGLFGLALVLVFLGGTTIFGSEAHLNALMLTAGLVSLWSAVDGHHPWRWFVTGLMFGLAILARLDNVFVVAALAGFGVMHGRREGAAVLTRAALGGLGGALVLTPYVAWNMARFGHITPISGAIKSTFPLFDLDVSRLGPAGQLAAVFGVASLVIGQFLDPCRRRRVFWRGLGAGVVIHALYVAGFTDHYTFWPWYYVPGFLAAGLAAAYLPGWVAGKRQRAVALVRPLVVLLTAATLLGGTARTWLKAFNPLQLGPAVVDVPINEYRWPDEFGRWMKAHLPPDARLFAFDWPGAIAYYSDLKIVPMDGLVNDFRYNDELLAAGPEAYLCSHGLRLFFGLVDEGAAIQQFVVSAPLYRRPAGLLTVHAEDVVVRTRDVVSRPDDAPPFAIWRVRCPT